VPEAGRAWLLLDGSGTVAAPLSAPAGPDRLLGWPSADRRPHPEARRCDPALLDPAGPPARVSLLWPGRTALPLFDDPAVAQARRAALAGPWPRAASALTVDAVHFAGSLWVCAPEAVLADPFALVSATRWVDVGPGLLGRRPRPTGPAQERYAGKPWPSDGWF
jgi:hypothetical protein